MRNRRKCCSFIKPLIYFFLEVAILGLVVQIASEISRIIQGPEVYNGFTAVIVIYFVIRKYKKTKEVLKRQKWYCESKKQSKLFL